MAKVRAARGDIAPVTSGRFLVRSISRSMSRSTTMFMALAPPAASVPPSTVQTISHGDGMPCSATIIVGTVVTRSSSMILGLVRATYAAIRARGVITAAVTTREARSAPPSVANQPVLVRQVEHAGGGSVAWPRCPGCTPV